MRAAAAAGSDDRSSHQRSTVFTATGTRLLALTAAAALAAAAPVGDGPHDHARTALTSAAGIASAQRFAATRTGEVAFAVIEPNGRVSGYNADTQFRSASVTKAMLLVAVLRDAATRPLTPQEQELLQPMITASDNDAADTLYERVGDLGLLAVAQAAGMRHFLNVGALFEARITAADQARLFFNLDRLVPARHRAYARTLLAGIVGPQRWGIAPVAARRHFAAFFKGGWRKGLVHQVALLERAGRRIALAILTTGEPSFAYGTATLAGIASRVLEP